MFSLIKGTFLADEHIKVSQYDDIDYDAVSLRSGQVQDLPRKKTASAHRPRSPRQIHKDAAAAESKSQFRKNKGRQPKRHNDTVSSKMSLHKPSPQNNNTPRRSDNHPKKDWKPQIETSEKVTRSAQFHSHKPVRKSEEVYYIKTGPPQKQKQKTFGPKNVSGPYRAENNAHLYSGRQPNIELPAKKDLMLTEHVGPGQLPIAWDQTSSFRQAAEHNPRRGPSQSAHFDGPTSSDQTAQADRRQSADPSHDHGQPAERESEQKNL